MEKDNKEKRRKKGGVVGWIVLLVIFTAAGYLLQRGLPGFGHRTEIDVTALKSELVEINELASCRKDYRVAVTKDKTDFFSKRYYSTFDGTIRAGINMEKVQVELAEPESEGGPVTVEVALPEAEILDHTDGNWKDVYEDGFQQGGIGDDRNQIIKDKKAEAEKEFIAEGGLDEATKKAKEVIENFIRSACGDDVVVTFKEI